MMAGVVLKWRTTSDQVAKFMVEKVKAAVAERTDPDFIIVARTNARRLYGLDEAMRRGEAFKKAGADMVYVSGPRGDQESSYVSVLNAARQGEIPRRRIDEAVLRILVAKRNLRLIK